MRGIALCLAVIGVAACAGHLAAEAGGSIAASVLTVLAGGALFRWAEQWLLRLVGARPLPRDASAHVATLMQHLASNSDIPAPTVYLLYSPAPNMLVAGRGRGCASIVLSSGLINVLDRDELAAILALALVKISSPHLWTGTVAAVCTSYLAKLAQSLQRQPGAGGAVTAGHRASAKLAALLAHIAAGVSRMVTPAVSDYAADAEAGAMIGDPLPLARALEKLAAGNRQSSEPALNPGVAHQFAVAPYVEGPLTPLCAGRPTVAERVARLREQSLHPLPEQSWDAMGIR